MKDTHQKILARVAIKDINPDEIYSGKAVVEKELIPWVTDRRRLRRIPKDVLPREKIEGETYWATRYKYKGRAVIKYIKNYSGIK